MNKTEKYLEKDLNYFEIQKFVEIYLHVIYFIIY